MSADVELNSGPTVFPCSNCAIEILDTDAALECDECGMWFHIQCQSIGQEAYDDLVATDQSFLHGFAQTVTTQTFLTPCTRPSRRMFRRIITVY